MAGNPVFNGGAFRSAVRAAAADLEKAESGRVTYDDVIVRTLVCLGVLVVGAAASALVPMDGRVGSAVMVTASVVAFVLSMVNSIKRTPVPALILCYALIEGLVLGILTRLLDLAVPGIGLQAVLGTVAVAAATLLLYRSGRVRATPELLRLFLIAAAGYLAFSLVNLAVMFLDPGLGPWGLNSGVSVLGIPLGVLVGPVAVVLASISLILDFGEVQEAVESGAPRIVAWSSAFGLTVTLVWLYLEILRLLAMLAQLARAFSGD